MSCTLDCISWEERLKDARTYIESLSCASGFSPEVIDLAVKYWAAHLVFITNPTVYIEKIKFVNDEKTYKLPELGSGYMASPYGQTADGILNGCISSSSKRKPSFTFSGTSF